MIKTPINSGYLWWQRLFEWLLPIVTLVAYAQTFEIMVNYIFLLPIALVFSFSFSAIAQWLGLYRDWLEFSFFRNAFILVQSVFFATLVTLFSAYALLAQPLSWLQIFTWIMVNLLILTSVRALLFFWLINFLKAQKHQRRVLIVGQGSHTDRLTQTLKNSPWLGYEYIGTQSCLPDEHESLNWLNNADYLAEFDQVFICLPMSQHQQIQALILNLSNAGKVVKYVPDLFSFELTHSRLEFINGLPVLSVQDSPLNSLSAQLVKRMIDIVFAMILLITLSPVMLIIAVVIRARYGNPIIFKQTRYGLNGREITVLKFRTMYVTENSDKITQATAYDRRVTPIGQILRRYNLDELPQLWNVLKGNMSLVGPRPHAKAHNEFYRQQIPSYMARHLVKPGITGWAQINGWRGETDTLDKMAKRVEFDLFYIKHWSIGFDLKILLLTLWRSFRDPNAY